MKNFLSYLLVGCSIVSLNAMQKDQESQIAPTNTLLIFLDDSEKNFGALTNDFFSAFIQEAAPLLVSTSLIVNIREAKKLDEKDPTTLQKMLTDTEEKMATLSTSFEKEELTQTKKSIIVSTINFDADLDTKWIIKEISESLYLLLPKSYLQAKNILATDVETFSPSSSLTKAEQQLNIKINHLKTVRFSDIKRPQIKSEFADYFISALPTIFVTKSDYAKGKSTLPQPLLSIYIAGHGMINSAICNLSIPQFKTFLDFLEKITTRVLFYSSCYAAGTNEKLLYEDALTGITKTYSFPIVACALTDASTYSQIVKIAVKEGKLTSSAVFNFNYFVLYVSTSDIIDYRAAAFWVTGSNATDLAQIKYPGLPWFSIVDQNLVASIGSILAKTRTDPLNIATFFKKKGNNAEPKAILFYAQAIPFELIVNTLSRTAPTFVSMIPGDAVHTIKKITAPRFTAEDILNAFYLKQIPHKLFVIDELTAPFSKAMSSALTTEETSGTLSNIVINSSEESFRLYFTYKGELYSATGLLKNENQVKKADEKTKQEYDSLLKTYGKEYAKNETVQVITELKKQALKTFAPNDLDNTVAVTALIKLLNAMPNNTVLHIPKISANGLIPTIIMFVNDINITKNTRKIIWIDKTSTLNLENIIVDAGKNTLKILLKGDNKNQVWTQSTKKLNTLEQDYLPTYKALFDYFDTHQKLDESLEQKIEGIINSSVQELLTPEAVAKIKEAQEKKIADKGNADYRLGKIVASNEDAIKNNPAIIKINSGLKHPDDVKPSDMYWLKPGTKVIIKQSDGSFTYGVVSEYRPVKPGSHKFEIKVNLGRGFTKIIPVGVFHPQTRTKDGFRGYSIDQNLYSSVGYADKSWFKKDDLGRYSIINPEIYIDKAVDLEDVN